MTGSWTRRGLLGTSLAAGAMLAAPRIGHAAARTLNVLSHRVHQNCLTTGPAGDLLGPWRKAQDAEAAWTTLDSNPLQDRLFREASLDRTDVGVGYLVNSRATPAAATLLAPLDELLQSAPIEDFAEIAPGLTASMRVNGKLVGVPVRHATAGLFYNEALLEERGISAPPASLEELVEQAKRLTYRAADGRPVVGMVLASDLAVFPVTFVRAFGGDFIGEDYRLVPDPAALERALAALRALFEAGALPRSYATTVTDDQVTWLQQGRAAFSVLPFSRYPQLNRPDQSRHPGKLKAIEFPMAEALRGKVAMATPTEFWAMSIPANSRDRELGWSFIREVSSKAVTIGAARNGNGPVRPSAYDDPALRAEQPLAAIEAQALKNARVPLPAFPEAVRAQAVFVEEVQLAVLGRKTPREAVASTIERVKPLMPA
ncbi:extracellular solute-binding protein [Roseomonas sp. OT10]|uniref:extracellular solute-binding protein n=1 Tax=Roseomonas cutis TaxID=2897332 RepID=UPI001E52FF55|nr:extracellular solute-binding protein [Roseomonas sp. OT10]UFN46907.1 extracellular solute-binding protein [Roseomonas sp. OT10]